MAIKTTIKARDKWLIMATLWNMLFVVSYLRNMPSYSPHVSSLAFFHGSIPYTGHVFLLYGSIILLVTVIVNRALSTQG
jgi:hypothetical protein